MLIFGPEKVYWYTFVWSDILLWKSFSSNKFRSSHIIRWVHWPADVQPNWFPTCNMIQHTTIQANRSRGERQLNNTDRHLGGNNEKLHSLSKLETSTKSDWQNDRLNRKVCEKPSLNSAGHQAQMQGHRQRSKAVNRWVSGDKWARLDCLSCRGTGEVNLGFLGGALASSMGKTCSQVIWLI